MDYKKLWMKYVQGLNERITNETNKLAIQQAEMEHTNLWDICERYIPCINLQIEDIVRPNDNTEKYRFESNFTITLNPRENKKDKYRHSPEGKIYSRVSNFNHHYPDRMIETALEAKHKYLKTGYIPSYIKNDDLI